MNNSKLPVFWEKNYIAIILSALILVYLTLGIYQINSLSITSDEASFFSYASRYLKGHPDRIYPETDNSKMPVSILNTLPRLAEQAFNPLLKKNDNGFSDLLHGRYITLFTSMFIILLAFHWATQLYGNKAGLFAAFLVSFCPNTLGNSVLVTTDSYSSLALLTVFYLSWKFCILKNWKIFCQLSIAVALSQLVKQSLFHLYIIIPLILLVYFIVNKTPVRPVTILKYFFVFIFINWLIINAGYYFYETNLPFGSYHFMSRLFQTVGDIVPAKFPCPFPKPFIEGLDMAKYYDQIGGGIDNVSSFGKVTILGKESVGGSFWYYYFISFFYKTPVSYFIFIIFSFILLLRFTGLKSMLQRELFLILPVLYYLIVLSFFYKTQCGIRHIIFIYPLLFILSSAVCLYAKNIQNKILLSVMSVYLVISVLFYYQNSYAYTNEFILDKKMAYKFVGASNLDFNQAWFYFFDYLKKHPEVKFAPEKKSTGTYLVSVEVYMDIWSRHKYDWMKNLTPIDQVAYTGLLFNITSSDSSR
jgi:hypothetical protein